MRFPWKKLEKRAESYTDALIQQLLTRASGNVTGGTSVKEIVAGLWARAFASATAVGAPGVEDALDAPTLYGMGRSLALTGRWIAEIGVSPQGLYLDMADSYNVAGVGPAWEWEYELSFARPSGQVSVYLPASRVVDVRLGVSTTYQSPLAGAAITTQLLDNIESKLQQETSTPVSYILSVGPGQKEQMAADLASLRGALGIFETEDSTDATKRDYQPKRFGASPPEGLIALRNDVEASLLAAAGVPNSIANADGTRLRESFRQFLFSTISPIGDLALSEMRVKLDAPSLSLDWDRLSAADVAARARALKGLREAGLSLEDAAKIAGLMLGES